MNKIEEQQAPEYLKYPFGSWPRLALAFRELTGVDLTEGQFDKKEKRGDAQDDR